MPRSISHHKHPQASTPPRAIAATGHAPDPSPADAAFSPRPSGAPEGLPRGVLSLRCRVKGCIFPVAGPGTTRCLLHDLAEREPRHFLSLQPSTLLLEQAKFAMPGPDQDDSRLRDRRRLALLREKFLEEVA